MYNQLVMISQQNNFLFQFNFVGKLLGPKGNSMKRLQEETMTKMAVLGRGSMRDKQKVRKIGRYYFKNIYNFSKNGYIRLRCAK